VDLTGDDVQDILSLLDGLPFGELHLQTARFSLTLRRAADGGVDAGDADPVRADDRPGGYHSGGRGWWG
jgi:hypothetical protein